MSDTLIRKRAPTFLRNHRDSELRFPVIPLSLSIIAIILAPWVLRHRISDDLSAQKTGTAVGGEATPTLIDKGFPEIPRISEGSENASWEFRVLSTENGVDVRVGTKENRHEN